MGNFPTRSQPQTDPNSQGSFPVISHACVGLASEDAPEPCAGLLPKRDFHFVPSWSLAAKLKVISFGKGCKGSFKGPRKD